MAKNWPVKFAPGQVLYNWLYNWLNKEGHFWGPSVNFSFKHCYMRFHSPLPNLSVMRSVACGLLIPPYRILKTTIRHCHYLPLTDLDEIYKHSFYICAIWDIQVFLLKNYCSFNTKSCCSDACGYHQCPQTLVEICRNMAICCSFRAVAAWENIWGSSYWRYLCHHWFRKWLGAWRHQAITWTSADWHSSEDSCTWKVQATKK